MEVHHGEHSLKRYQCFFNEMCLPQVPPIHHPVAMSKAMRLSHNLLQAVRDHHGPEVSGPVVFTAPI